MNTLVKITNLDTLQLVQLQQQSTFYHFLLVSIFFTIWQKTKNGFSSPEFSRTNFSLVDYVINILNIGITDEVINSYGKDGIVAKSRTFLKFFMMLLPIMVQALDSVLDALYFIKLKTDIRLIQVDPRVQVAQAFLLFTCK